MAKLHVLNARNQQYSVVLHTNTPSGTNAAGKSWADILISIRQETSMAVGTGPGQITQAEADSVASGNVLEIRDTILLESGGMSLDSVNEMVDRIIDQEKGELQAEYKYYGYTLG